MGTLSATSAELLSFLRVRTTAEEVRESKVETVSDAKGVLMQLGYLMHPDKAVWTKDEFVGITLFQTMMGLFPDGIVGPKTKEALAWRIRDRFLAAQPTSASVA